MSTLLHCVRLPFLCVELADPLARADMVLFKQFSFSNGHFACKRLL